jgi:hypothetical protein
MKQGDTIQVSRKLSSTMAIIFGSGFYVGEFEEGHGLSAHVIKLIKRNKIAAGYFLSAFKGHYYRFDNYNYEPNRYFISTTRMVLFEKKIKHDKKLNKWLKK